MKRGNFRSWINQYGSNLGGGNNYYSRGGSFNSRMEDTTETTRISANGIPNLSTSVVAPGGYHVQSLSQRFQNPYRKIKQ
jgi:hypothetical protein